MRHLTTAACAVLIASGTAGATAHQALAAKMLCVGGDSGCYSTLQVAVDAAHDGDTILVEPGTFKGGVSIDVSVRIVGAGPGQTIIRGGASVLTIGSYGAPSEPTVSIVGLTITGGVAHSSPESIPFVSVAGVWALGGGLEIPPAKNFGAGATVSIVDSVITGNRAAPTRALPLGPPCPGNANCPFALAGGGGINNWGATTLTHTIVRDNQVGGPFASDANGAGIYSQGGTLTLNDSVVTGNQAMTSAPNGRFADSGGIFVEQGALTINKSAVTNNSAQLSAAFPNSVQTDAQTGGVHIGGDDNCAVLSNCVRATIRDSLIEGNSVRATNSVGDAVAFVGGINDDGVLALRESVVTDNHVTAIIPAASGSGANADSGGLGIGGVASINATGIVGNTVSAVAPAGLATATAGGIGTGTGQLTTLRDSFVSDNHNTATTNTGSVTIQGVGINNGGLLALRDTTVDGNTGSARGPAGVEQGGGIWNGSFGGGPPGQLSLNDSAVTRNALRSAPGITAQGAGLYTVVPVTLVDSFIGHNVPDQCYGC
jgi:hypothetical protein